MMIFQKELIIFFNLRKNEMLIASMLESFLTYTEVITGSWLPYTNLKNLDVCFESVNSINEINSILLKVIKFSIVDRINILEKNRIIIQKEFSFENDLNNWIEIYK